LLASPAPGPALQGAGSQSARMPSAGRPLTAISKAGAIARAATRRARAASGARAAARRVGTGARCIAGSGSACWFCGAPRRVCRGATELLASLCGLRVASAAARAPARRRWRLCVVAAATTQLQHRARRARLEPHQHQRPRHPNSKRLARSPTRARPGFSPDPAPRDALALPSRRAARARDGDRRRGPQGVAGAARGRRGRGPGGRPREAPLRDCPHPPGARARTCERARAGPPPATHCIPPPPRPRSFILIPPQIYSLRAEPHRAPHASLRPPLAHRTSSRQSTSTARST
jgi:hypothetical protein